MNHNINMARAGLAGLVWGFAFGGPFLVSVHQGGPGQPNDWGPGQLLLILLAVAFGFAPMGLVLSAVYAAFLGAWEQWTRPGNAAFLAGSVLLSALCATPLALWYATQSRTYGPDDGFTGPQRLAVTGFVAAILAGYVVGRYLPQTGNNPAQRAYDTYSTVLWIGFIWGLWILVTSLLFPTFADT